MQEAIKVIEAYQTRKGIEGFLETLQTMRESYDDLTPIEQMSFDQFVSAGQKMFAPA